MCFMALSHTVLGQGHLFSITFWKIKYHIAVKFQRCFFPHKSKLSKINLSKQLYELLDKHIELKHMDLSSLPPRVPLNYHLRNINKHKAMRIKILKKRGLKWWEMVKKWTILPTAQTKNVTFIHNSNSLALIFLSSPWGNLLDLPSKYI